MTNVRINGQRFKTATEWQVYKLNLVFSNAQGGSNTQELVVYDPGGPDSGNNTLPGAVVNAWDNYVIDIDFDGTLTDPFLMRIEALSQDEMDYISHVFSPYESVVPPPPINLDLYIYIDRFSGENQPTDIWEIQDLDNTGLIGDIDHFLVETDQGTITVDHNSSEWLVGSSFIQIGRIFVDGGQLVGSTHLVSLKAYDDQNNLLGSYTTPLPMMPVPIINGLAADGPCTINVSGTNLDSIAGFSLMHTGATYELGAYNPAKGYGDGNTDGTFTRNTTINSWTDSEINFTLDAGPGFNINQLSILGSPSLVLPSDTPMNYQTHLFSTSSIPSCSPPGVTILTGSDGCGGEIYIYDPDIWDAVPTSVTIGVYPQNGPPTSFVIEDTDPLWHEASNYYIQLLSVVGPGAPLENLYSDGECDIATVVVRNNDDVLAVWSGEQAMQWLGC